jgi:hypothetical protein
MDVVLGGVSGVFSAVTPTTRILIARMKLQLCPPAEQSRQFRSWKFAYGPQIGLRSRLQLEL